MSIRYDGEASGGVDSTTASGSLGRGERSLGKPVRVQERLWTLSKLWLTSPKMQEKELVSVRDSAH